MFMSHDLSLISDFSGLESFEVPETCKYISQFSLNTIEAFFCYKSLFNAVKVLLIGKKEKYFSSVLIRSKI